MEKYIKKLISNRILAFQILIKLFQINIKLKKNDDYFYHNYYKFLPKT